MAGSKQTWHGTPSGRRWSIDPTAIPSPIALRSLPPSAMETYSMLSSDDRDDHHAEPPLFGTNRNIGASLSSLNDARVQFALTQTPPMGGAGGAGSNVVTSNTQNTLSPGMWGSTCMLSHGFSMSNVELNAVHSFLAEE
ncbi:unnamed protein product [Caenorhabditis auriculariae]|uniref:Uncharacterized protein n=1 Tax=Caenorhabditis auriculariae TaxID=2777116 RepID=A0A8S1GXL8_9PELO|nr:unnamed protein product [Caenorhabditis auriculariae]